MNSKPISETKMQLAVSAKAEDANKMGTVSSESWSLLSWRKFHKPTLEKPHPLPSPTIVVLGDEGSGKTSLVHYLRHGAVPFHELPPVLAPVLSEPEEDDISTLPFKIWDTLSNDDHSPTIANADCIVLCVDHTSENGVVNGSGVANATDSFEPVVCRWLSLIAKHAKSNFIPVVVCVTKAEKLTAEKSQRIHNQWETIRTRFVQQVWLHLCEVSVLGASLGVAKDQDLVFEVFRTAIQAAANPIAPLLSFSSMELSDCCRSALVWIFRKCDVGHKGFWTSTETNNFHAHCFDAPMSDDEYQNLKTEIQRICKKGISAGGDITEAGFLAFCHHLLTNHISRNPSTVWSVLRAFEFDSDVVLSRSRIALSALPNISSRYELNPSAERVLRSLFRQATSTRHDQELDTHQGSSTQPTAAPSTSLEIPQNSTAESLQHVGGSTTSTVGTGSIRNDPAPLLHLCDLERMLEVVPDVPRVFRRVRHHISMSNNPNVPEGEADSVGLSLGEFFLLWHVAMALEPQKTVRAIVLLGFEVDASKDEWPCHVVSRPHMHVFDCAVVGAPRSGKSALCASTLTLQPEALDVEVLSGISVGGGGIVTGKVLVLRELRTTPFHQDVASANIDNVIARVRTCDCAIVCYDGCNPDSLETAIEIQRQISQQVPHVGILFVGTHSDTNPDASTALRDHCAAYCAANNLVPPVLIVPTSRRPTNLWSAVVSVCESPKTSRPRQRFHTTPLFRRVLIPTAVMLVIAAGGVWLLRQRREAMHRQKLEEERLKLQQKVESGPSWWESVTTTYNKTTSVLPNFGSWFGSN